MKLRTHFPGWLYFLAFTALGYLTLALHRWVFYPAISQYFTVTGFVLTAANLVVGGICFLKSLSLSLQWWANRRNL